MRTWWLPLVCLSVVSFPALASQPGHRSIAARRIGLRRTNFPKSLLTIDHPRAYRCLSFSSVRRWGAGSPRRRRSHAPNRQHLAPLIVHRNYCSIRPLGVPPVTGPVLSWQILLRSRLETNPGAAARKEPEEATGVLLPVARRRPAESSRLSDAA